MTAVLVFALKSTLLLGGALLVCRLRWWSATERHLLLLIGVCGVPALGLLEQLPERSITVPAPAVMAAWDLSLDAPAFRMEAAARSAPAQAPVSLKAGLVIAYAVGTACFLFVWLVRLCSTGRWIGRTRAVDAAALSTACPVPVRVSERIESPLVWGILEQEIVLPECWRRWPAERTRAVLAHELAHLRRHDTLTAAMSGLICCLFWIHPLMWVAQRRIRMEAERACDDAVLEDGFPAVGYAELLLDIERGRGGMGAALAIVSENTLPTRIRALLNPDLRRAPMNRFRMYAICLLAVATVGPLASVGATSGLEVASTLSPTDTDLQPRVKVGTIYPKDARDRGIEGYVVVEFTVTETGETTDARVIEAEPEGVFEAAALQAVARYRYQPRVVDGEAVAVTGIRNRVAFDLEQGGSIEKEPVTRPPGMSESTYARLTTVQSLIDEQDFEAAERLIDELKKDTALNGNELAQVHNMAGFVEFSRDDFWGAVTEYEQILAEGDAVPEGLRKQTLYTLAQLNYVNEEYRAALRYIEEWSQASANPGPTPQIFMAQAYYQLQDYPSAIEHLKTGLDQARDDQVEIRENWWALLGYLYVEEELWTDAAAVLEILARDFPKEKYRNQLREVRDMLAGGSTSGV